MRKTHNNTIIYATASFGWPSVSALRAFTSAAYRKVYPLEKSMKLKVVAFFILLLVSGFSFSKIDVGDAPFKTIGKSAAGDKIDLDNYKGKVVILTFWATWCSPCMKEIPVLSGIQKRVGTDHLQVIAVSYHESKKMFRNVSNALSENPIIFTFDKNSFVSKKYGVKAIPHMVIIGRDGIVKARHIGYSEEKIPDLVEEINALLAEKS